MSPSPKFEAVIFDLDGTLLNTAEGIVKSLEFTIKTLGYSALSKEKMLTFIGPPIKNSLKNECNLTNEEADIATNIFRERYKDHDLLCAVIYPHLFEVLDFIKNRSIKIGVATYKREDYALSILKHFEIFNYCDSIKGSDHESLLTKKDILNNCILDLSISSKNVLYVGDSESDGLAAADLNAEFLGVSYGYGFKSTEKYNGVQMASTLKDVLSFI